MKTINNIMNFCLFKFSINRDTYGIRVGLVFWFILFVIFFTRFVTMIISDMKRGDYLEVITNIILFLIGFIITAAFGVTRK